MASYILVCSAGGPRKCCFLTVTADISPQNVLTAAEDEIIFKDIEDQESQDPSTPIMKDGVPLYRSRAAMVELSGIPILTDFGQMRLAEPMNNDWWMSDSYRAPEVLLKLPWAFPVDVWSVGVMVSRKAKYQRGVKPY